MNLDEQVHGNTYRMAARGNATSFPLPWQDLLTQLQDGEVLEEMGKSASLPRTGRELTNAVSMLFKTSGEEDMEKNAARIIHQAMARRRVAIELIDSSRRRGHAAYKNVDMEAVREKAKGLPEEDVPPEIIRLLPLDDLQDKIRPQKNATPVSMPHNLEEAAENLEVTRCNGVVNEKSSMDEVDAFAQDYAALQNIVRKLRQDKRPEDDLMTERVGVKTGNLMIDQFVPWYFSIAFAFYVHL